MPLYFSVLFALHSSQSNRPSIAPSVSWWIAMPTRTHSSRPMFGSCCAKSCRSSSVDAPLSGISEDSRVGIEISLSQTFFSASGSGGKLRQSATKSFAYCHWYGLPVSGWIDGGNTSCTVRPAAVAQRKSMNALSLPAT